jgi:DNA-binding transcriptional LysR family regulator
MRHLRYVVAIAEDLHFARAANRLHLAAPSLSKQIRQLETLLGYPLFERRTRQVALTTAGSVFVVEAREALNHVALAGCGKSARFGKEKLAE